MAQSAFAEQPGENLQKLSFLGQEIILTPLCVYKLEEACRLLCNVIDALGMKELLDSLAAAPRDMSATQAAYLLMPLLRKIVEKLPHEVRYFVALCSIPNTKLAELYQQERGIAHEVESRAERMLFECSAVELAQAFAAFVEQLQVEDLKNALGRAGSQLSQFVRAASQPSGEPTQPSGEPTG